MALEAGKIIYGGDMMLFVASKPVAFSTAAKLDISQKTIDIGSKDSGYWEEKVAGKMSWSASSDALMCDDLTGTGSTYSDLYTAMTSRTPVALVFAATAGTAPDFTVSAVVGKTKFSGTGFITSLSLSVPDGDKATYSISFEGTGALVMA